ncbi:uncharacterized protein LOC141902262 [Tubulanus polymorphus]|uniref:uncharacterized protein LOC141902262 n=1 Tax=Tubulanus polymorphus TaxID=672921 RepID=UPI003DA2511D
MERKIDLSLCAAISRGFFGQVRYLIEFGSDINERDVNGRTPLMLCTLVHHTPSSQGIAQTLLEKGARVGHRDRLGLNALHYACIWEKLSLVKLYLSAVDYDLNQGDRVGNTAIFYAVDTGNVSILKELIKTFTKYNIDLNRANKQGVTPLSHGLRIGQMDCVKILKNAGVDEDGGEGEQPLSLVEGRLRSQSAKRNGRRSSNGTAVRNISSASIRHERGGQTIKCALPNDLRNDPEYMFNLRPIDCFVEERLNGNNSLNHELNQNDVILTGWRNDFRHLYKQYEVQCSNSWRQIPEHVLAKTQSLHSLSGGPVSEYGNSDSFATISGAKRALAHRRGLLNNSSKEQSTHGQKRSAAQHRLTRKGSVISNLSDSLNSSSESLNSSGKKADDVLTGAAGRRIASRTAQKESTDELPPIKEMN